MSQEYLSSTISSFLIPQKKASSYILHPMFTIHFESFRVESNEERKKRKRKNPSVSILDGEGGKKRKGRGGEDRIFWRMAKAVDTRFAERRHEACRASTTAGVPTSVPDERRRISVPRNVVERASSACRRRPIPLLFVSRFTFTRSRHVTGKNLKDDG